MELKPKYQFTYFIKPFIVRKDYYKKYLTKIAKDKNFNIKIWDKQADFDVYTYFEPQIRDIIFFGFNYARLERDKFLKQSIEKQVNELENQYCVSFNYTLTKDTPGKMGEKNGIFFYIEKLDLICFNSGICFLLIKTYLDNAKDFSEILNFNYKFKDIDSEYSNLKEYEKINIQTDIFNNSEEIKNFIENIICQEENEEIEENSFYVYSYTCIDGENWNEKKTFDDIKVDFWKYRNVLPSNYNLDVNLENEEKDITNWEYAKFGFNKNACVLLSSSLSIYNYTKLPYEYEKQYMYSFLLTLYQKLYFNKIIKEFKQNKNMESVRENLNDFIKKVWIKEITKESIGTAFYKKWQEVFELDNLYLETMNLYDLVIKDNKKSKLNYKMKFIVSLLVICIILNIINILLILFK